MTGQTKNSTTVEKVRDEKGYATLLANVAQFGEQDVRVYQGGRKVYDGSASEFVSKYSEKFAWTLCADVREANGKPEIIY